MAEIKRFPFIRHLRSEPSRHVLHYRNGELVRKGRGLAFWFVPLTSSLAEIPCDDRELPFLFHGRSSDFQDVTAMSAQHAPAPQTRPRVEDPVLQSLPVGRYLRARVTPKPVPPSRARPARNTARNPPSYTTVESSPETPGS